jgi:glycosyltransferase involved in cell wall biosynthesis
VSLRIVFCSEFYWPSVGGVQEVIRQLAENFVAAGDDVTVLTSSHPARNQRALINGVNVLSFDISGNNVLGLTGDLSDFHDYLLNECFDVLVIKAAQQWSFDAALSVLPFISARKVFIPCGFSRLKDKAYQGYYSSMRNWLGYFDDLIFATSNYQDYQFAVDAGTCQSIHIVPNGVSKAEFYSLLDQEFLPPSNAPGSPELHLLSVGALLPSKGHWEVLRAYSSSRLFSRSTLLINGNNIGNRFSVRQVFSALKNLILGYPPLWLEILIRYPSLLLQGKSVRVVNLPRKALLLQFQRADLFVFASHVEYSPLVLYEAAASGTAFISSAAGNSPEIAQQTRAGVVVPPLHSFDSRVSVKSLALAIEALLHDPALLASLSSSGRTAVLEGGFTWDSIALMYRNIFVRPVD